MKQIYTAIAFAASFTMNAQDCSTGRYVTADLFPNVTVTNAIVYGANTGVNGSNQTLRLDVYQPTGDVLTDRPAVIVAFGGSFISGSRGDVADICEDFARRGYVAIAPDYRVGFFLPNEATTIRAVMRGAHDMKAVVRFLRKSVAENGNPYGIDPNRIIVGGVSAGGISGIHAAYLDQESEIPAILVPEMPALGGVEGNSGSPGYSSEVFAVYSFSGAIGDTLWIVPGDAPICSIHEVGDGVVPYYTEEVSVIGIPTGLMASGSHDLHIRCTNLGLTNCFKSYTGNGHVGYLSSDYAVAMDWTALFLGQLACGADVTCGATSTAVAELHANGVTLGPNPTTGAVAVQLPATAQISLFDTEGRLIMSDRLQAGSTQLDLSHFAAGVYTLVVEGAITERLRLVKAD